MAKKWRVGYYVELEVEAYEGEAAIVGECAAGWPGVYSPPRDAITVHGVVNSHPRSTSESIPTRS